MLRVALVVSVLLGTLAAADPVPVPPADVCSGIQAALREVYAKEYAARTREARAAFAAQLLGLARASADKPQDRYVLLRECIAQAAKAGEVGTGLEALDDLSEHYLVVRDNEYLAFADTVATAITTPDAAMLYLNELEAVVAHAIERDDYPIANRAASAADGFARRLKERAYVDRTRATLQRVKTLEKAYAALGEFRDPLGQMAPPGFARYGWFLCIAKQEWAKGIEMLRQGDEPVRKALAEAEAVASDGEQLALAADGWYDYAKGLRGDEKLEVLAHAAGLYRQSMPALSGLSLARSEQRLGELTAQLGPRLAAMDYPPGPALLLTFEAMVAGTSATDASPSRHVAMMQGGVVVERGDYGSALRFDGTGRVTVADHPALRTSSSMTLMLWLRPQAIGARRNPWHKCFGAEGTLTLEPNGVLNLFHGVSGRNEEPYVNFAMDRVLTAEVWAHVVMVRDLEAKQMVWYRDAAVVKTEPTPYPVNAASTEPIIIGHGYVEGWIGLIDEVALYGRALSVEEITSVYNATKRGR